MQKLNLFYHVTDCRLFIKFEKSTEKILALLEKKMQDFSSMFLHMNRLQGLGKKKDGSVALTLDVG